MIINNQFSLRAICLGGIVGLLIAAGANYLLLEDKLQSDLSSKNPSIEKTISILMGSDNGLSKVSHAGLPNTAPYEFQGKLQLMTQSEMLNIYKNDHKLQELMSYLEQIARDINEASLRK